MSEHRPILGGTPVGQLADLEGWEARLVANLRNWFDGVPGQTTVIAGYAAAFGEDRAWREIQTFDRLLSAIGGNMHRRLVRHGVNCTCVGSDEALLVTLVRLASEGDLHEASLLAALMVRPSHAEIVALLAGEVGSTLRELENRPAGPGPGATIVNLH